MTSFEVIPAEAEILMCYRDLSTVVAQAGQLHRRLT